MAGEERSGADNEEQVDENVVAQEPNTSVETLVQDTKNMSVAEVPDVFRERGNAKKERRKAGDLLEAET
eukprot:g77503.t1